MTSTQKKRVGIVGIYHESNTFVPDPTTLEIYKKSTYLFGEEIREKYSNAHHEISGFIQTLSAAGIEVVPICFVHAAPWGKVTDEALDHIWGRVLEGLDQAGPLDGIMAAPHGAGVNESRHDMDGWWLTELRKKVGKHVPIVTTMDPHVNFSPKMLASSDAMVAYRENPHLDQKQRGIEAATIMVRTLNGEIKPVVRGAFPPIAINIERQLSFAEPMLSAKRELEKTRALPGVLSASIALGFPYADVPDMGSAFLVVTDNDPELAQREADRLAGWLIENRELYRGVMISPQEAYDQVAEAPKPVGLLDMGDNMGGGAPADSMILPKVFQNTGRFKTLVKIADAENVLLCKKAGIGARLRLKIGGKLPMTPDSPLETEVTVVSFHDGNYTETQPRHGGKTGGSMGACVVVQTDQNLTILLSTKRAGSGSAQIYYSCGLKPEEFDVVILQGVHAPVGAFQEICPTLIRVNTPGVTTADMNALTYHHRRKPLFPFEEIQVVF